MHAPSACISCSSGICPSPQLPISFCLIGDVTRHLVNSFKLSLDNGIVLVALGCVNLLTLVISQPTNRGCFWHHCFIFSSSGTSAWGQSLSSLCPKRTSSLASASFSCQPHDNSQSCLPDLSGFHSFFRGFDSTGSG